MVSVNNRPRGSIIKSVHLENFKGIGALTDIPLKPVTLLFGSNSAGKSTVLHALLYAREILTRRNIDPDRTELGGERVDLGGFANFVHEQNIDDNSIELGFTLDLRDQDLGEDVFSEGERFLIESATEGGGFPEDWLSKINEIHIGIHIEWSKTRQKPVVWCIRVEANGKKLVEVNAPSDSRDVQMTLDVHHEILIGDEDDGLDSYMSFIGQLLVDAFGDVGKERPRDDSELELSRVISGIPVHELDDALPNLDVLLNPEIGDSRESGLLERNPAVYSILVRGFLTGLICGPLRLIRDELNRLTYLGPLRDMPPREFLAPKSPDKARWAGGMAAWDILAAADSMVLEEVNDWLYGQNRLNSSYLLKVKRYKQLEIDGPAWLALTTGGMDSLASGAIDELYYLPTRTKVSLVDTNTNTELQPQDVGVGISQLMPVIIASLVTRMGLVAIEQPELHIHPGWQVVLGDLFLTQSKENNTTFLIETHSEHLLLRLLKRIRQTASNTLPQGQTEAFVDDVGVLFVGNDNGNLEIRELEIDEHGRMLDEWPTGFFEEAYNETFKD